MTPSVSPDGRSRLAKPVWSDPDVPLVVIDLASVETYLLVRSLSGLAVVVDGRRRNSQELRQGGPLPPAHHGPFGHRLDQPVRGDQCGHRRPGHLRGGAVHAIAEKLR